MPAASLVTGTRQPWGPRWGHPERGEGCVGPGGGAEIEAWSSGLRSRGGECGKCSLSTRSASAGAAACPEKGPSALGNPRAQQGHRGRGCLGGDPGTSCKGWGDRGREPGSSVPGSLPTPGEQRHGSSAGGAGTDPSHEWGRHQEGLYPNSRNVRQPGHCPPPQHLGIWVSIQATVTKVLPEA